MPRGPLSPGTLLRALRRRRPPAAAQQLPLPLSTPPAACQPDLKDRLELRLAELWARLQQHRDSLGPLPRRAYDLRGRCAGQYVWKKAGGRIVDECLRFNLPLADGQPESFLAETVGHELAHCAAVRLHGHGGHGAPWRRLMHELGLEPRRCHAYDTRGAGGRGHWPARCDCREHDLSSVLRNRINQGRRYLCRHCGTALMLIEPGPETDG